NHDQPALRGDLYVRRPEAALLDRTGHRGAAPHRDGPIPLDHETRGHDDALVELLAVAGRTWRVRSSSAPAEIPVAPGRGDACVARPRRTAGTARHAAAAGQWQYRGSTE